jgi:toxin FitB
MYLLDTNVISELRRTYRRQGNYQVVSWASSVPVEELYLSVITVEELEIGVLLIERRDQLQGAGLRQWLNEKVLGKFADRILPVDQAVVLSSARLHVPDPRPIRDAFIAATAHVHDMTLVTRNISDFERTGVSLLNPWEHESA